MRKYKIRIAVFSILLALCAGLGVFLCVWFFGADYARFDALTEAEAPIPGLESGLSPQGLCPLPEESGYSFAMSGYLKGKPSRIYLFGGTKEPKYITVRDERGDISTHFGGIACTGNYLAVASGNAVVRVSLQEALGAADGAAVAAVDRFEIEDFRSVAYCYVYGGLLYAGEFYRPGNYETDGSHHLEGNGETNYGLVYAYEIDENAEGGIKDGPLYAVSVREQVQGIAVWENGVALSTSYGLPDSKIFFYNNPFGGAPAGEFNGIPLYRLDGANCTRIWETPCMSEEIFEKEGKLYLLYESASKQYKSFVRRQIRETLSVQIADLLA